VAIGRAVPNVKSERPAVTRDFFVGLLGFVQVTIVGNDDTAAPGISVEVDDVDAVHAGAVEHGFEIAYPLRGEEGEVRRFMLREPSGTIVNALSHRSGRSPGP
jgi:hypothetical protein